MDRMPTNISSASPLWDRPPGLRGTPTSRYSRLLILPLLAVAALHAQQPVAPTTETLAGPRGDNVGNYNVTQSFEFGYRWHLVGGDDGMYRSVDNYRNGLRLLSSSLTVNSRDGHGGLFDEIVFNTLGLANDPYQSAMLRISKNRLYRYDMLWRSQDYYNPGLTIASGFHLEDTTRHLQDHDLTLLPESRVHFRLGYSRDTENGPALTTSQEFTTTGPGLPVFTNVRRQWNEYRLGLDANLAGWQLAITRRWDYFKDDSPVSRVAVVGSGESTDSTLLQQFNRSQPVHGANPGWFGNLFTRRKFWNVDARMTYVSGNRDFALVESSAGIGQFGDPATRQILVGGNASRPDAAGDFSFSLFPTDRLTFINTTSVVSNRIDGTSNYTEYQNGSGATTINFRYLGIRTVANLTDVNYRISPWLGVYAAYNYSDRLVKTIEAFAFPPTDTSLTSDLYQVSNHLNSGRLGLRIRPVKPFTINLDGEVGRTNNPLTPIADKNYHSINGRAQYRTRKVQLSAIYRQAYNLNNSSLLAPFSSHSRQYSGNASWSPIGWFTLDAAYSKLHLDTQTGIQFFASATSRSQLQTAFESLYRSNIHAGSLTARFTVRKRADLFVGYSITKDTGDGRTPAANPVQVLLSSVQTFPLTYESPMTRVSVRISPKVRWNAGWQYYAYGEEFHLFGFNQNYHAHTGYTSVLWAF